MSRLRADKLVNRTATGAPQLTYGAEIPVGYGLTGAGNINITGIITATSIKKSGGTSSQFLKADGSVDSNTYLTAESQTLDDILTLGNTSALGMSVGVVTATSVSVSGNISVGGTLTYEDVTNVDSIGVITARSGIRVGAGQSIGSDGAAVVYYGDGSNLDGVVSGIELQQAGSSVGTSLTAINFASGATLTTGSGGISTITIAAGGIGTEASTGGLVTLDLTAQDHKVTATGITTITVSGGTEGDSHTVRIVNSGIATVGFSTYFLFPSGATPTLPTGDGAISLISFTVNRVGAAGTQLLAGASLNFS